MVHSSRDDSLHRPPHSLKNTLATVIGLSLVLPVAAGVALAGFPQQALAQVNTTANHEWNIPAGSLESALNQVGRQAGILLSYPTSLVAGKSSPGVQGSFSLQTALDRLLTGTGLIAERNAQGQYQLREAGNVLPAVNVSAQSIGGATEGSGSYTTSAASVGGKMGESLREVPRSISVVGRQQLDDQHITSFNEAIAQLPGVTFVPQSVGNAGDSYYVRGHSLSNITVDGAARPSGRLMDTTLGSTSMSKYDNIQLLRGPDGLFSGNGEPSGSINLMRKKPLDVYQLKTTVSAGSWNNYLGEVDISSPLTASGNIRGRAVASHNDTEKFYENAHRRYTTFYGVVDTDLTDSTLLTVGVSHDKVEGNGADNPPDFPRFADGRPLPLSRSAGYAPFVFRNNESTNYFATLEQELSSNWKARVNVSHTDAEGRTMWNQHTAAVDPAVGDMTLSVLGYWAPWDTAATAADINLLGNVEFLGRNHRLALGMDSSEHRTYGESATSESWVIRQIVKLPVDNYNPDLIPYPRVDEPVEILERMREVKKQHGLYGYGSFEIYGPWKLVVGGRYASNQRKWTGFGRPDAPMVDKTYDDDDSIFTPYYAVIYDFSKNWSAYFTTAESYEDQSQYMTASYEPLDPTKGRSHELGLKGEFYDGQLNTNFTLYRTERDNYRVSVGNDRDWAAANPGKSCCYSGDGEFLAQGIEVDISGALTSNWQVNAGYTYDDNKTKYGNNDGNRYASYTPKHIFRLWSSYQLSGALSGLKVGGGVQAQSGFFRSGTVRSWNPTGGLDGTGGFDGPNIPYNFNEPGRAVWNSFAEYRIDENWTAALNVNNVFDKHYFQSVGTTISNNYYGAPRSWVVTLRGHF